MRRQQLNDREKRDWIILARTENVGPITFKHLLQRYGTVGNALDALPALAKRGGKRIAPPHPSIVEDEVAALDKLGGRMIALCEPEYPEALAAVEDAPPVISVIGHSHIISKKSIGVVGARNATLNGRKMAERLAGDLGKNGLIVVSGLARGIDTSAHAASLDTGTVAVVAGGVDVIYPEENRSLYKQICEVGAVVSDQPLGCEPIARLFPKRNRIISGLSLGVVVVEAAKQSGSLITARIALEQGREVFAVPGSPLDPRAAGTNELLRSGAVLVETADDVFNHIYPQQLSLMEPSSEQLDPQITQIDEDQVGAARAKILENLGCSPVQVDELVRQCQLSPPLVLTVLLELELAGRIERQPGKNVALIG